MARTHRRVNVAANVAAALFKEADAWREKGDLVNEQKALDAARSQLALAGIDSREAAEMFASERVAFTAAEETARDALEVETGAEAAAAATAAANEGTLRTRAETALTNLKAGANAIKNGPLFADRTANERAYLELLGRGEAALIRLALRKLDDTD